ncbi:6414_t:CDS:2, partial [Racocetra persica]
FPSFILAEEKRDVQPKIPITTKKDLPYIKFKKDYPCAMFELRTWILAFKQALDKTTLNEVESCINDVIKDTNDMEDITIKYILSKETLHHEKSKITPQG